MRSLSENLASRDLKGLTKHPRMKMLDEFHKRINIDRERDGMKALPVRAIGIKTSHLSLDDLGYLLKKCQQSSNFSKMFFGLLKVKSSNKDHPNATNNYE